MVLLLALIGFAVILHFVSKFFNRYGDLMIGMGNAMESMMMTPKASIVRPKVDAENTQRKIDHIENGGRPDEYTQHAREEIDAIIKEIDHGV